MDLARPGNPTDLLNLSSAAQYLAVSIDVLLAWNENNILKPTITTSGEIVYTRNQLDKFKAIQNTPTTISREALILEKPIYQKPADLLFPINQDGNFHNKQLHQQQNNFSQINNYHFHNHASTPAKEIKASISIKKLAFTLSFFGILLLSLALTQQSKLNSLLFQNPEKGADYDSHTATIETTNNKTENNIKNEGSKIAENNTSLNKESNNSKTSTNKSDQNKLTLIESVLGVNNDRADKIKLENEIATYGQRANMRSTNSNSKDNQKSDTLNDVFDTEGNIKVSKDDPSEKELLATAIGTSGLTGSQDLVRQNTNTAGAITFIILGLVVIYFIYSSKRQLLPSSSGGYNQLALQPVSFNTQNDLEWEKILEIDQKTDGSVVIIFHGKEYKLSKPELDSESDKFIERLMQLTNSGLKEIEYDALSDSSLTLNTPLSKIVTRLGFVGIKRDLFFPRTSKSRVLFRKYLTLDDLFSMNMTIEDLSNRFSQIN